MGSETDCGKRTLLAILVVKFALHKQLRQHRLSGKNIFEEDALYVLKISIHYIICIFRSIFFIFELSISLYCVFIHSACSNHGI